MTGDDFGLAVPVNEAIAEAHVRGILTAASLMVSADAAADALQRARRLPSLRVGLHLVLVEGRPALPPEEVPDLVDAEGRFSTKLVRAGVNFFFRPGVRRQIEAEVRAQFEAFRRTGLALDHVNAHNHMHLHPTVLGALLRVGREYGMHAVRVPYEPPIRSFRASRKSAGGKAAAWLFFAPWMALLKARLRHSRLRCNDYLFGMSDSGAMTADLLRAFLRELPEGVTEIYFHPATRRCAALDRAMPGYDHQGEFQALTQPGLPAELEREGIERIAFSDL